MKGIEINGKEHKVIDNWADLTIEKYMNIAKLHSRIDTMLEEEYLIEFIKIISTMTEKELESMYEDDLTTFIDIANNFNVKELKAEKVNHFILNDKVYSFNNHSKLTLGEKISLKLLEKQSTTEHDTWLNILAILIRPAKRNTNEFNEETFEVEPFMGDIDLITKRKDLIKNIPAVNALYIIEGFTRGRE